jgi:hypothetical protein
VVYVLYTKFASISFTTSLIWKVVMETLNDATDHDAEAVILNYTKCKGRC